MLKAKMAAMLAFPQKAMRNVEIRPLEVTRTWDEQERAAMMGSKIGRPSKQEGVETGVLQGGRVNL